MKFIAARTFSIIVVLSAVVSDGAFGQSPLDITYHELELELRPKKRLLEAKDRITFTTESAGTYALYLGSRFGVKGLRLDGRKRPFRLLSEGPAVTGEKESENESTWRDVQAIQFDVGAGENHVLEVEYGGVVHDTIAGYGQDSDEIGGIVSEEGVYLSSRARWYPDQPLDLAFFRIKVKTPRDFEAVTEGKRISRSRRGRSKFSEWDVHYPTKDITLVAGRFDLRESKAEGVDIMAYFFPSEVDLVDSYIEASARFIDLYNRIIGPYPFTKFAVVENFFPTGYGMPSYTLLGKTVMRSHVLVDISLGHEVAHNWWGNSVYVDERYGNWAEGLTVYYADYLYERERSDSAAAEYRRRTNINYSAFVDSSNDFPLSRFQRRTDGASQAVGYGKCAMVFHMLERLVGEETFYRAFRSFYRTNRFKEVSWAHIRDAFEQTSGRDLGTFFQQWVERDGAPLISLESASSTSVPKGYEVSITLTQDPVFDLHVPVTLLGKYRELTTDVHLSSDEATYKFDLSFEPTTIMVDPHHHVFRRMDLLEIPPSISAVLGSPNTVVVLPSGASDDKRRSFEALAETLKKRKEKMEIRVDTTLTVEEMDSRSMILLGDGHENRVVSLIEIPEDVRLAPRYVVGGETYGAAGHSAFLTLRNPFNLREFVCVVVGGSASAIEKSGYKLVYYGNYGYVTFLDGEKQRAGLMPANTNPLVIRFGLR